MFDINEQFIKNNKEIKKAANNLPVDMIDISSLYKSLAKDEVTKKEIKNNLKNINKILNFGKITMSNIGIAMLPMSVSRYFSHYEFETYINTEDGDDSNEINYRYMFSVAFDYAALIYYKEHCNDTYKDIPMCSLMHFRSRILNADKAGSGDSYYQTHIDAILNSLSDAHNSWEYMLYLNMRYLDSQFTADQKSLFKALSNKDYDLFKSIVDRK